MAGTDSTRGPAEPGGGPAIILVEPQLGQNIGMVARAMLNCGLTELRLVAPRDGWPNPAAVEPSSGATIVLDRATVFDSLAEAIADLGAVYATTARPRDMVKEVLTPRAAASDLRRHAGAGTRAGVLFGKEAKGLKNDDVALADAIIEVPLNPAFCSLNLAQAVLLVGYEWFQAATEAPPRSLPTGATRPATKAEMQGLFDHFESELDASGFLHVKEKRPTMIRNLRNVWNRAAMTEQEVRTWRGIIVALTRRRG